MAPALFFYVLMRRPARPTLFTATTVFRSRLLDHLVLAEAEQLRDRVVGLEDFALQVRDEHRVRGVFDQALGVGPRLVQIPHTAQQPNGAACSALQMPQRRCIQSGADYFAR